MNEIKIECDQCGGTDFYKEAGYFYCKFCQVQSQEVQEYAFDDYAGENTQNVRKGKKVQSQKGDKSEQKITSWECYNYILLGLTQELINLGADKKLKSVVRLLWLQYLQKLEVFKLGENTLPKLQATCSGMDAEIIYGKLAKSKRKRRKSSSSEKTSATVDTSSIKHERIKRKKALVQAQYEDLSQKSRDTSSLHNETLASLQTSSEKSSKKSTPVTYNYYTRRELKRMKISPFHMHKHRHDFGNHLRCHKFTYRKLSHKYINSPYILSLNKLYAILYLGLLLIKDKIHLSDMLRYIKEGHLSFNCYSHLFPEDFSDKVLNFHNFKKNIIFSNSPFRIITSEMSVFLDVQTYISCANLIELAQRYCKELNLPQEISECTCNIILQTNVKMSYMKRFHKVPNYEGRVLSIILFVLKLFFGLDDVTEFHLGKYTDIFNVTKLKLFNIVEWLKHIEYRNMVMTDQHFATSYSNNINNVKLSLAHFAKKQYPTDGVVIEAKENYKNLLTKLKDELFEPDITDFPVSLTPFSDYAKIVQNRAFLDILSQDFADDSLMHILQPMPFFDILQKRCNTKMVHAGANENWKMEKITCCFHEFQTTVRDRRKFLTVKLNLNEECNVAKRTEKETKINAQQFKKSFHKHNEDKFKENEARLYDISKDVDFKEFRKNFTGTDYPHHYNPYERFWLRSKLNLELASQKDCHKFLEKFPNNFRLVFKECQRIAHQNEQEFLIEYQFTELFLIYSTNFGKDSKRKFICNQLISSYLRKHQQLW